MAKLIELRSKLRRQRTRPPVSLVVEGELCDADLRNLIDSWIVPKMVDEWIGQLEGDAGPVANEDNGEHS